MKWKEILEAPIQKCKKKGNVVKAQRTEQYLILDFWENGEIRCRHAMDIETGEYGTNYPGTLGKTTRNVRMAAGGTYWSMAWEEDWRLDDADEKIIDETTKKTAAYISGMCRIEAEEEKYQRERYADRAKRKQRKIEELMARIPEVTQEQRAWMKEMATGGLEYAFRAEKNKYTCTACGQEFEEKLKDKQKTQCPHCGREILTEHRKKSRTVKENFTIISNVDEKMGVERHFKTETVWRKGKKTTICVDEIIRLFMLRDNKKALAIYYRDSWGDWSTGNIANRRWKSCYLYPDEERIKEGLNGTSYKAWKEVMPMMARAGQKAEYNNLLVESNKYWAGIAEYMVKGGFSRLIKELSERISVWEGYTGRDIDALGKDIREVLKIKDRQLINRIRQEDGGINMLTWMQHSEERGIRISAECCRWMEENGIYPKDCEDIPLRPEQLMHYLARQAKESYTGRSTKIVLAQYKDYIDMAKGLGKDLSDAMVYRPKDLKKRHDEAVKAYEAIREAERRKRDKKLAEEKAQKMREKYPGYEDLLEEIKEKYEYENEDYLIKVPKDFNEITDEGMALHHCVGNTERYFDRIVSRETYICFLRQQSSPETPYYTIEVEPGGTIRQHRGAYDEEPEIEKVKPFLREWQKTIRSRMKKEDHEYAKASEILREKNIEELREKKNTRVLNGLIEDLMLAI